MRPGGGGNGRGSGGNGRGGRSAAEWTTLAISLALILGLAGLVAYQSVAGGDRPPVIEATPLALEARREGDAHYLPIAVANRGARTAQDVRIRAELALEGGRQESAEFVVDVLAGGETTERTAVFSTNPAAGNLTVRVTSFR